MVSLNKTGLGEALRLWLTNEPMVQSAVLFGSSVWADGEKTLANEWSDFDFHLVASHSDRLEHVDWSRVMPDQRFCLQASRPATGGVRKVTVIFSMGQVDLVIVPSWQMRFARRAFQVGLHRRHRGLRTALNEMSTCLASGYRFWKGQEKWAEFYGRIAGEMQGVRLTDDDIVAMASVFLCELLWVVQKIGRSEFSAAQHALHRQLGESNFRFLRELRLRRNLPLPSFGIGRRVETLLSEAELSWVKIDARPEGAELQGAAIRAYVGMTALLAELIPSWRVPVGFDSLLALQSKQAIPSP